MPAVRQSRYRSAMYHATRWGIEGFVESVAQQVAPFGIGMTIVEPGGARTEFRYRCAPVAEPLPIYDKTHGTRGFNGLPVRAMISADAYANE